MVCLDFLRTFILNVDWSMHGAGVFLSQKNKLLCMSMRCCLIHNKNTTLWKVNAMLWCGHFTFLAILGLQVFVLQIEYKPFE